MRRASVCALLLLALGACAPQAETVVAPLGLDCALPFDAQAARLVAQQQMRPAPEDPAEPYRFYSSENGRTSYLITRPGAPGHPAILMQRAAGGKVKTTGCPYGDRKSYAQLLTYLESLKTWRRGA